MSPPGEVYGSGRNGRNGSYAATAVAPLAMVCPVIAGDSGSTYSVIAGSPLITCCSRVAPIGPVPAREMASWISGTSGIGSRSAISCGRPLSGLRSAIGPR